MTTTPPEAPSGPPAGNPGDDGPRVTRDEMRDLGRLRRSATDRKVAGVAGGLARHLDVDPLILRVAFVVLAFFGGAGLILYGACWLLVPEEETGEAAVNLDERSRTLALLVVGAIAAFALIGDSWGVFWFPWPLAIVALVVLFFITRKDRRTPPGPAAGPQQPAGQYTPQPEQWNAPTYPGYTGYAASPYPETGPAYGPPEPAPARKRPRDPRRRGPILFWFTLALITLGLGILGTIDVAGAPVADGAYPALAVGTIGVMLLVGAFCGRAGGLIVLGLVASFGLAGATAADQWDGTQRYESPDTAALVQDKYDFGAGEIDHRPDRGRRPREPRRTHHRHRGRRRPDRGDRARRHGRRPRRRRSEARVTSPPSASTTAASATTCRGSTTAAPTPRTSASTPSSASARSS